MAVAIRMVATLVCVCLATTINGLPAEGQEISAINNRAEPTNRVIVSGIVTSQNKYSITLQSGTESFEIVPSTDAVIALKMNKPWFDWDHQRVIVDAVKPSSNPSLIAADESIPARVPFDLPSKELYVIGQFDDASHMQYEMAQPRKRLNYYVITPTDIGKHFPRADAPYLCGKLDYRGSDDPIDVVIGGIKIPLILGFQNPTMNGFSITDLKPVRTEVKVSGTIDNQRRITANRILFHPVRRMP